ncbi:23158_t:CDS:10, partial [Dentiscutata erythropus]
TRETDERGRAKSKTRETDERGRAKSKTRETDERGRAKSKTRETNEHGRTKSRTREHDDRERAEKSTRDKEYEILMEKEKFAQLRREKTKHETKHETHHEKDDTHTSEVMIYIEELRQYREMTLTSNTTALDVLTHFRSDDTISDADAWTLFEVIGDLGLERPFRDWEFVTKIIGSWELDKDNSLVLKKYAYRNPLTLQGFNNTVPPMAGYLHLEVKKNKWQKRYFQLKDGSIYHSKDAKGTNETFLCSMNNMMRKERPELFIGIPSKNEKISSAPINLGMPLTNALPAAVSETTSLMSEITFELSTLNVSTTTQKPFAPAQVTTATQDTTRTTAQDTTNSTSNQSNQRDPLRHSGKHADFSAGRPSTTLQLNTKELKKNETFNTSNPLSPPAEESKKKQYSGPFKGGSLLDYDEKNPPTKPVEPESVTFVKGSLLATSDSLFEQAKEREKTRRGVGTIKDLNGNNAFNTVKFQKGSLLSKSPPEISQPSQLPAGHLVQIEEGVRFHKGSLLSKSPPETSQPYQMPAGHLIQIEEGVRFHKGSLLAKSKEHYESHSANERVNRKIAGGGPLLTIDSPIANSRSGAPKLFSPPATTAAPSIGSGTGRYPDSGIGAARIAPPPGKKAPPSVIAISGVNRPTGAELPICGIVTGNGGGASAIVKEKIKVKKVKKRIVMINWCFLQIIVFKSFNNYFCILKDNQVHHYAR